MEKKEEEDIFLLGNDGGEAVSLSKGVAIKIDLLKDVEVGDSVPVPYTTAAVKGIVECLHHHFFKEPLPMPKKPLPSTSIGDVVPSFYAQWANALVEEKEDAVEVGQLIQVAKLAHYLGISPTVGKEKKTELGTGTGLAAKEDDWHSLLPPVMELTMAKLASLVKGRGVDDVNRLFKLPPLSKAETEYLSDPNNWARV